MPIRQARLQALPAIPLLIAGLLVTPLAHAAAPTVRVQLWDKGGDSLSTTGHGLGEGDPATASMSIKISPSMVKAGDVNFEVVNKSKEMIHEMVVVPEPAPGKELPFDKTMNKFDEDAAGHLGEVSELEPGKSGAVRLHLKPGRYLLICNIPGHYTAGMWTTLTVK